MLPSPILAAAAAPPPPTNAGGECTRLQSFLVQDLLPTKECWMCICSPPQLDTSSTPELAPKLYKKPMEESWAKQYTKNMKSQEKARTDADHKRAEAQRMYNQIRICYFREAKLSKPASETTASGVAKASAKPSRPSSQKPVSSETVTSASAVCETQAKATADAADSLPTSKQPASKATLANTVSTEHGVETVAETVPEDILRQIFILCASGTINLCFKEASSRSTSRVKSIAPDVLIICRVSSHWRSVALETCELWSDVRVTFENPNVAQLLDVLDNWFSHSGQYPLSLHLRGDVNDARIAEMVVRYSNRLRVLSIRSYAFLASLQGGVPSFPTLQRLHIGLLPEANQYQLPWLHAWSSAVEVSLTNASLDSDVLSQIAEGTLLPNATLLILRKVDVVLTLIGMLEARQASQSCSTITHVNLRTRKHWNLNQTQVNRLKDIGVFVSNWLELDYPDLVSVTDQKRMTNK
ncbi:hypothetical protein B0H14DRAFT_3476630 [Mycena olivaceomarginata]|nr:hypothetical protein B0H14DRAFT_3476630 [Mycena olivaceomarginata]